MVVVAGAIMVVGEVADDDTVSIALADDLRNADGYEFWLQSE